MPSCKVGVFNQNTFVGQVLKVILDKMGYLVQMELMEVRDRMGFQVLTVLMAVQE